MTELRLAVKREYGDASTAASSGSSSTAASSGDCSTAASSGHYSKAASSGDYSKAASSGDCSKAASSGDYSRAASSGSYSTAASSGRYSTSASSGSYSTAASSGSYSTAASSGRYSTSASSGRYSTSASSGSYSTAASSGSYSTAASSGDYSKAASSGDCSTAASSGDYSKAASSGDCSTAASSGKNSACTALGYRAAVKGDIGNLIMASEYVDENGKYIPVGGKADIVDGKKLKAGCWYIVENNEWTEVDLTDGVLTRVISSKACVKKVKNDHGQVLYIVSSGKFNAHGKTIKEAREALLFKTSTRDVSEYKNMPMKTKKTPAEWAVVYHVVTGACQTGCTMFMEKKGKLKKKYTLEEIIIETKGAYGHEKFVSVVRP